MTTLTTRASEGLEGVGTRDAGRAKNLFALGLLSWLYDRPTDVTERWIEGKFASKPAAKAANLAAFQAGWSFGETTELLDVQYKILPATDVESGTYRQVNGTTATALGLLAGSVRARLPLLLASYPITPASELLHELSKHEKLGVRTVQAEDEIAAAGVALGAAFGGHLGITSTSGPGMDLKAETIGLALMLELPMVIVDVQRAGPSTGLPTKTEQSDLLMAMYGRHGDAPLPIVAAQTAGDCFASAFEAVQIAIERRTPVILLTDGFLANSSEPWRIPALDELPEIDPGFASAPPEGERFLPYARDERGVRPWAPPGTPGLEHRIGGIEKQDGTGNISYDPANHAHMTRVRAAKVSNIAADLPPLAVDDPDGDADVLVIGWGSTYGSIRAGVRRVRDRGLKVAQAHVRHINPLPSNIGEVLRSYDKVLVPEMNTGQLVKLLRAEFLVDCRPYNKITGQPLYAAELEEAIVELIEAPSEVPA